MGATPSYREANRARLREALIGAARELTVRDGWAGVRMADVAAAVGVSRQTVYNEFRDRAGLAEALAATEIRRLVAVLRAELFAHGGDARAASRAAVLRALREAANDPLVRAILTSGRTGAEELLPFLTTRSELLLSTGGQAVRDWAEAHRPEAPPEAVALAAESAIRLTVSHVMHPRDTPAASADAVAEVFARLLT
jgi:AcrR family transcriptional regulator